MASDPTDPPDAPPDDGDDGSLPPGGRFDRFRRLAGLGAQLGADVVRSGARRIAGLDGAEPELLSKGTAEKLVATLGSLKGAAMKFGQMAAMDPDLLTPEVRQVLARLQNQAPAMPYAQVARVVEEELGQPPERLFAHFERAPFAAASLGQVHRARLADGREVAVKVQYPGIRKSLEADLANVGLLVRTVSLAGKGLDGSAYYAELCRELLLELDYRREA
jgi:predicted unusual protein kinase regulating ubiquinone biosynthesis (AarF/ABC1/UbiB family)